MIRSLGRGDQRASVWRDPGGREGTAGLSAPSVCHDLNYLLARIDFKAVRMRASEPRSTHSHESWKLSWKADCVGI